MLILLIYLAAFVPSAAPKVVAQDASAREVAPTPGVVSLVAVAWPLQQPPRPFASPFVEQVAVFGIERAVVADSERAAPFASGR